MLLDVRPHTNRQTDRQTGRGSEIRQTQERERQRKARERWIGKAAKVRRHPRETDPHKAAARNGEAERQTSRGTSEAD